MATEIATRERKAAWQRRQRREFRERHGYSTAAHYATAGRREAILERDGYACVRCGMTDTEHRLRWSRPITVDHVSKDRTNNSDANLQTLCLSCHGRKDQLPRLRESRVAPLQEEILSLREAGETYQAIADRLGFSIAAVWKWLRRWEVQHG